MRRGGVQQVAEGGWCRSKSMSLTVNHPMTTTNRTMGDSQVCQHKTRRCKNGGRAFAKVSTDAGMSERWRGQLFLAQYSNTRPCRLLDFYSEHDSGSSLRWYVAVQSVLNDGRDHQYFRLIYITLCDSENSTNCHNLINRQTLLGSHHSTKCACL